VQAPVPRRVHRHVAGFSRHVPAVPVERPAASRREGCWDGGVAAGAASVAGRTCGYLFVSR
jgi:hypothetical protein